MLKGSFEGFLRLEEPAWDAPNWDNPNREEWLATMLAEYCQHLATELSEKFEEVDGSRLLEKTSETIGEMIAAADMESLNYEQVEKYVKAAAVEGLKVERTATGARISDGTRSVDVSLDLEAWDVLMQWPGSDLCSYVVDSFDGELLPDTPENRERAGIK